MRLLPTLAIVCAVTAALTALVFVSGALVLPAIVAIVAGVFLVLRKDRVGLASGGAAIILGLVGALAALGSVGTEKGTLEFGLQAPLGHALVVVALLAVPAGLLWMHWDQFDQALSVGAAATLGVAVLLALVFQDSLSNQTTWPAFIVALLALVSILPGVLALRTPE